MKSNCSNESYNSIEDFFVICKGRNFLNDEKKKKTCERNRERLQTSEESNFLLKTQNDDEKGESRSKYKKRRNIFNHDYAAYIIFCQYNCFSHRSLASNTGDTCLARIINEIDRQLCLCEGYVKYIAKEIRQNLSPTWVKSIIGLETHIRRYRYWMI